MSVILCSILFSRYSYAIVLCTVSCLALLEYHNLIDKSLIIRTDKISNVLGCIFAFGGAFLYFSGINQTMIVFIPYISVFLYLFIAELYSKKENPVQSLAYSVLGQLYIVLPFSLTNYIAFNYSPDNTYHYAFLLALFVMIWVNDSFAYVFGVTLGKHRLFERISPKKSWEGFIGGAACTLLSSLVFAHFFKELSMPEWIGFAAVTVIFGTFGDLIESLIKRTLKIKDSGNILPGHGGILDRFDSMIFAIPALVVYIEILNAIRHI